jgi:hypothetical protein
VSTLFVGQSHVAAIRAARQARRDGGGKHKRTRGIHTLEQRYVPELVGMEDPATAAFGPLLRADLDEELSLYRPTVASVLGGNAHNALALVRHPRGYDFLLAGDEQGPARAASDELIPLALVRAALLAQLGADFLRLRMLRDAVGPFVHVESPPPLRDDRLIAERADAFFRDQAIATLGVAPAGLRWRMWRLNSMLFREQVAALGCRFLAVPAEAQDADGFLRPELAADATHGNVAYGEIIIRAVEAVHAGG